MRRFLLGLVLAAGLTFLPGCGGEGEPDFSGNEDWPASGPIIVIGIDGFEWEVILPLLAEERLPNLAALMERGSYGYLTNFVPTFSPVVWTSVATGKTPAKHGIPHFARRLPNGQNTLYDNLDRKTKALWNILSDYDRTVSTIGWWMTFPVEEINGVMVAQTNTIDQLDTRAGKNVWKGTLLRGVPGQVHPPARQNEMLEILKQVNLNLSGQLRQVFGEFRFPLSQLAQRLWNNCKWAFRADTTYLRIALGLTAERPLPDLTLLYLGGPDVVGHRFWRYMQPDLYLHQPPAEQIANLGDIIEDYYVYTDQAVGKVVEVYGSTGTVILLSDHGMHPVNLEARFDPDDPPANVNSGNHQDAPVGVFVAAGPGIRRSMLDRSPLELNRSDLETVGGVLDLTPTLLAMMRIPVGKDMDGHVLKQLFDAEMQITRQPRPVATHDTAEFLAGRERRAPRGRSDEQRLDQLRSLGYIEN